MRASSRVSGCLCSCFFFTGLRKLPFCQDHRSIARFIAYALCAAEEALRDACWLTIDPQDKKDTVISGTHPPTHACKFECSFILSSHPEMGLLDCDVICFWKGVSIGGGIGSISDILDAAQMICDKVPNRLHLTFVKNFLGSICRRIFDRLCCSYKSLGQ